MSIRSRILLGALIPLLALLALTRRTILHDVDTVRQVDRLAPIAQLACAGGDLVHMLQPERGSSVGYLSGGR